MHRFIFSLVFIFCVCFSLVVYGEQAAIDTSRRNEVIAPALQQEVTASAQEIQPSNITLDFKDADIRNVLKIIALKTGVNIVASPDVSGTVSIYLDNVPWEKALDVILRTYGFGYEKKGNVISVAPLGKLTEQRKMEMELSQVQPTVTEVFNLKYIDAIDAKNAVEPLLSARGKITVLEMTGKAGWEFGGESLGKKERKEKERKSLTKVLLITEIPPVMEELRAVLKKIDVKPKQIMIETKILEVSRDYLEDIGFEYSTNYVGASDIKIDGIKSGDDYGVGGQMATGTGSAASVLPSVFNPSATGLTPANAGLQLVVRHLVGSKFETIFHALEEDVHSNLLSAPRIMTLDNQEATILVGNKYPILSTSVSGTDTTTTTTSLDYYQDIGIQLNVVPQISGENKINMIIHPAVTSYTSTVGTNLYPIIITREAETQVIINDGETIVIGGLIKDYDNKEKLGVPFLSKIPILGALFRRNTTDTAKIELLIFITAHIVDEDGLTKSDVEFLENQISQNK
ncbi:MAG: type IV pilus secretin PilQ [Candidatus Omnitrophica bacterium]|nr:type IV pilus secretin PilQ [Candidatus Omnitrophota bacterium]MDD5352731.1 type IV pilus secretin PilQ [Candidatus Omnitrophota bacterium]MDD5550330.1 type IV pilus secretin PilQ [Candidatus Omnitrophota bacterium]